MNDGEEVEESMNEEEEESKSEQMKE